MTWWSILILVALILMALLMALSMVLQHREKMAGVEPKTGRTDRL